MSYSIEVTVTDGEAAVTVHGPVLDGNYVLAGHVGDGREDISARRSTPDNRLASQTSASVYEEVK